MSVQPGPTFKRYAANGIATVYAIPFLLLDAADLQITLDGVLVTTGFALSGIGTPTSSCTFTAPPAGDLLFQQVMVFQRLADYQMNGDFLSGTVNRDYDRLWLAVKQLSRDNNRALNVSLLEPEGIPTLPVKAQRALKVLAFDANGDPVTSNLTLTQIEQQPALALASAAAAAASATASAGSAAASAGSAAASASSATLSQQWAENPEDVPVTPGLFSAHHWANKAAALVASISALYTRMTAVELRATNLEFGYISTNQTYSNGGTLSLNHGLAVRPLRVTWEIVCVVAEAGYSVGAIIYIGESQAAANGAVSYGISAEITSTQILAYIGTSGIIVINKGTKAASALTPASWALRAKASKS
ncbi:hypothetical protein HX867_04140 [Pseudomonas gingeri]|uniref:hypothetical protein n=1 Tax=Pseudomonas gingeri TaxID=117681 RepID=UPI00159FD25B|nr:hypothetical protein [Pseudomonas gingeri]NVZ61264.1 hypothetical protein [Pseudomonas gingeri]NVZ77160.1 hypothetical protein [Pseudomonas gingeri]